MSAAASSQLAGAAVGALAGLVASPYLARLTLSVPDRDERRWWTGRPAPRARVLLTAAAAVLLGVLGGLTSGFGLALLPFVLLAVVGAPLVVIDFEHHRLPNRLVFVVAVGAPLLAAAVAAAHDDWSRWVRAVEAAAVVFAVLFALAFVSPRAFGYGDVKLGAVLAGFCGWYGWTQVYYGLLGGFVLGAVVSLVLLVSRRATMKTAIPFGPMLVVGPLVILAFDLVPSFG